MYEIETLAAGSSVPIFRRIFGTFSLVIGTLFIIAVSCYAISISPSLTSEELRKFVLIFIAWLAIFSLSALFCLAWMTYTALVPLRHLIQWAKNVETLEKISLSQRPPQEIKEVSEIMNAMMERLREAQHSLVIAERDAAIGQVSAQVAHDIRSPLAALEMIFHGTRGIREEERILMRSAVDRIRDIANHLLSRTDLHLSQLIGSEARSKQMLVGLVERIVSEKRLQFRSQINVIIEYKIGDDCYQAFSLIHPGQFKSVLSNLINNAVEAFDPESPGRIIVELSKNQDAARIQVHDNGKGIETHVLAQLGKRGITHGKAGGTGRGIHHAKTCIESWGGKFNIVSQRKAGTQIQLSLPLIDPPGWFAPSIQLKSGAKLIVVDDDISIHNLWNERGRTLNIQDPSFSIVHFSKATDLQGWCRVQSNDDHIFLIDYEFNGSEMNGIQLIQSLNLEEQSILVTSHFDNLRVMDECLKSGIRLLPKACVALIPIEIVSD
jgi:signal transduction histidine kinase